ncbi:MAG: WD40 repeat domain-containing protein, partial [Spirochaetes bacterium]|nr:WD40 repeat domain-containing protein [Spirochaetota bacterium]
MKRRVVEFFLFMFLLWGCEADEVGVLQNGHNGPILAMAKDERRNLLFTGGKDGTIRVWTGTSLTQIRKIQVSNLPILSIAVDSKNQRIGLVESNGLSQHFLSVWDWESGIRKYHIPLREFPLFMQFSPQGTFIGIGKPTWQSLTLYDGETGEPLPYLQEGFGIVNFFLVSASENTLLSYSPASGSLIYWNLREGTRKSTIRTVVDLKILKILTERYAIGYDGKTVYLIDLVTGETLSRVDYSGITSFLSDPAKEELITLSTNREESRLSLWKYRLPFQEGERGSLFIVQETLHTVPTNSSQALFWDNRILVAHPDGTIGSYQTNNPFPTIEGRLIVEPISDLQAQGSRLLVTTKRDIWIFPYSFLETMQFTQGSVKRFENPYGRPLGIRMYQDRELMVFTKDSLSGGVLALFNPSNPQEIQTIKTFPLPLLEVWPSVKGWYCLEKGGSITRLQRDTWTEDFQIPAGDIQSLLPLDENTLLLGKNAIGHYGNPLLLLEMMTRETIPLQIPGVFMVFRLLFQPSSNRVFILALRQGKEKEIETVLYMTDRTTLEQFKPVAILRSEELETDIVTDPATGELLTTLGTGSVRRWDGS